MQTKQRVESGQNLYGILNSIELGNYLEALDVRHYMRSPSARQAYLDLMAASHHATAGTGLDAFIRWSSDADELRNRIEQIKDKWNRIDKDNELTVHYLARELRLQGDTRLEAKLANYNPRTINMTLRSLIARVREPMDAYRVIEELAQLEGMHPYQVNTVLSKLAKKTSQKVSILHEQYDKAIMANTRGGVDWPHYTVTRAGLVKLLPTYENFQHLLRKYRIDIRYNLMNDNIDIVWPDMNLSPFMVDYLENVSELKSRCAQADLRIAKDALADYVRRYAGEPEHEYHPVRAWLESAEWDELDRWDVFMGQLNLPDMDAETARARLRQWFNQALDCLYQPKGVEHAAMLCLLGKSGTGKTLFFKSLIPAKDGEMCTITGRYWPDKEMSHEWQRITLRRWLVEITGLQWRDLLHPARYREFISRNIDTFLVNQRMHVEKLRYRRTAFVANVNVPDKTRISKTPDDPLYISFPMASFTPDPHLNMQQFWAQLYREYHG